MPRLCRPAYYVTELGLERWCGKCRELWPLKREFWYFDRWGQRTHVWCRACYNDWKAQWRYRTGRRVKGRKGGSAAKTQPRGAGGRFVTRHK